MLFTALEPFQTPETRHWLDHSHSEASKTCYLLVQTHYLPLQRQILAAETRFLPLRSHSQTAETRYWLVHNNSEASGLETF